MTDMSRSSVFDRLGAVKDAMTVSRAFGDSYQVEGVTIIPVAAVRGGGGGGSGVTKEAIGDNEAGTGSGMGFGATVRPIGVVVVNGDKISWQPTVDVMRIVLGAQLLALASIFAVRRILEHRS